MLLHKLILFYYRLGSWRRANPSERERPWEDGMGSFGLNRIHGRFLDTASDNSNRRQYGMGVVGRFFGYVNIFFLIK